MHGQMTPYGHQQQLLPSLLTAHQEAGTTVAACLVSQDPGRGVNVAGHQQATEACEEETTMCLREQLISSRCIEQRWDFPSVTTYLAMYR